MVVKSSEIVPGDEHGSRRPCGPLHQRIQHAYGPVLTHAQCSLSPPGGKTLSLGAMTLDRFES
jgi:hypothetical protein